MSSYSYVGLGQGETGLYSPGWQPPADSGLMLPPPPTRTVIPTWERVFAQIPLYRTPLLPPWASGAQPSQTWAEWARDNALLLGAGGLGLIHLLRGRRR